MNQVNKSTLPNWSESYSTAISIAKIAGPKVCNSRKQGTIRVNKELAAQFTQLFWKLREKIENNPDGWLHVVAMVAEELRLFFDVESIAVFFRDQCVHRSLTTKEFDLLMSKVMRLGSHNNGDNQFLDLTFNTEEINLVGGNDNLTKCNRLFRATNLGEKKSWEIWLWLATPQGVHPPNSRTLLFELVSSKSTTLFCKEIGLLLDAIRHVPGKHEPELKLLSPPKSYLGLEHFLEQCKELFLPLDSILEPLRQRLVRDVCEAIGVNDNGVSCMFSIRTPETDAVHFYVSAEQVREIVKNEADIKEFCEFCAYRYGPGVALSGWVLETASCLYLENFTQSNLWTRYIENTEDRNQEKTAQLTRVSKFFRVEELDHKHAYLLPVLFEENRGSNIPNGLRTIIMLSITTAKELDSSVRRHIYELVHRLGSAIRVALDAQLYYEVAVQRAVLAENITPLTRFITHQLANRSNFLRQAIITGNTVTDQIATACNYVISDIGKICQIASSYHKYLSNGSGAEELGKEVIDNFQDFIMNIWESAWEEFIRREPQNQIIRQNSYPPSVGNIPRSFKVHSESVEFLIRNLLSNSIDALDRNHKGRIEVTVSYLQAENVVRISVSDNGPGVTSDTKQKLLSGLRLSRKPGTNQDILDDYSGYGWFFVRLFAEAHGATLNIPWAVEQKMSSCVVNVDFPV